MHPQIEQARPMKILLVDDNPADIRLMQEALHDMQVRNQVYVAQDGEQALAFLHQTGPYAEAPRPDLIVLDVNLPKKDGHEVLAEMKADATLRRIPVVILTTSQAEADIVRAYDLHANCYIIKPVDLDAFYTIVKALHAFWFETVTLPTEHEP
jgi:CheY-like chemotaxis protein